MNFLHRKAVHGFGLLEDLAKVARRPVYNVEDPSGYPDTDLDLGGKDAGRKCQKKTERFNELIDRISRDPDTFHALAADHLHSFHSQYLDQCLKVITVLYFILLLKVILSTRYRSLKYHALH